MRSWVSGPCDAVPPSDVAPALLALDAEVLQWGWGGERTLPPMESFALPVEERHTETAVRPDEIFLSVPVPPAS